MPGAKNPKYINSKCYGEDLRGSPILNEINLKWIIEAYNNSNNKEKFFKKGFNKLAGNDKLQEQIINGSSENEIKSSWKSGIEQFQLIRSKYLIYY